MEKENRKIEVSCGGNGKGDLVFGLSVGDYALKNLSPIEAKQISELLGKPMGFPLEITPEESVFDMNLEDRSQFEQSHNVCIVEDASGNTAIMVGPSSDSEGNEYLTLLNDSEDTPFAYLIKDDIRKLRDYLNNYLENNFEKK